MSIKPLPHHYSIENPASIYDEEALTALELAGRTTAKVNEAVAAFNVLDESTGKRLDAQDAKVKEMNEVAMPNLVNSEIRRNINNGTFDTAIDQYAGGLEKRVDNLFENVPEGGTTMDAEVVDGRLGANGKVYPCIGGNIRDVGTDSAMIAGDRVSPLALAHGYQQNLNRPSMWEQGWIGTDGVLGNTGVDNELYIRLADFVPETVERIVALAGIRLTIVTYDKDGYFLEWNEYRQYEWAFDHASYKYRVMATGAVENVTEINSQKRNISVSDAKNILLLAKAVELHDGVSVSATQHGYKKEYNHRALWEQGYIFGSTGLSGYDMASIDSNHFSRTAGYIPAGVECVVVEPGYTARLYTYALGGAFSTMEEFTGEKTGFNHLRNKYRLDVRPTKRVNEDYYYTNDTWDKVKLLGVVDTGNSGGGGGEPGGGGSVVERSPFLDDGAVYAPAPYGYFDIYFSMSGSWPSLSSTVDKINAVFDNLVNSYPDYVTKFKVGNACDGSELNAYRFKPTPVISGVDVNTPKIIIIGGQHGFEKGNVVGLTALMHMLATIRTLTDAYPSKYDGLRYLATHVEFVVLPIVNPTGYAASTYKNANGVNLNRNYDYKWVNVADTTSDQYGGEAPFDQPETQAVRNLILNEENVSLVIDSHSMGSGAVPDNKSLNWFACCGEQDEGYARMRHAIHAHLAQLNTHFFKKYNLSKNNGLSVGYCQGFDGAINTVPSLDNWLVYNHKIKALTLEGFNGYPGESSASPLDGNGEILLNFILQFCHEYGRR